MFILPSPGLKIRDPILKTLVPSEGVEVTESPFWLRRVRDGDVTVVQPTQAVKRAEARKVKGE